MPDILPTHEQIQSWTSAQRLQFVNENRSRMVRGEDLSDAELDLSIFALRCERSIGASAGKAKASAKPAQASLSLDDL